MTMLRSRFTRADYARLPEGFPAQLLDGSLVKDPAPTYGHQGILTEILARLLGIVPRGRVLPAPVDVPIDEFNVFQPDLAVFDEVPPPRATGTLVPRIVLEVASPHTGRRDRRRKRPLYLRAGVEEVWIVDPDERSIEVHSTGDRRRVVGSSEIRSRVLPAFVLVPDDLFPPTPAPRHRDDDPPIVECP
jgi:Uma2 family endonuclease